MSINDPFGGIHVIDSYLDHFLGARRYSVLENRFEKGMQQGVDNSHRHSLGWYISVLARPRGIALAQRSGRCQPSIRLRRAHHELRTLATDIDYSVFGAALPAFNLGLAQGRAERLGICPVPHSDRKYHLAMGFRLRRLAECREL